MPTIEELKMESLMKAHQFVKTLNKDDTLINRIRVQSNKDQEGKESQKFMFEFSNLAIAEIMQKAIKDLYGISCGVQKTRETGIFLLNYNYPLYPTETKSLFESYEENSALLSESTKEEIAPIIKEVIEKRHHEMAKEKIRQATNLSAFFLDKPKPSSHKKIMRTNSLPTIPEIPVVKVRSLSF